MPVVENDTASPHSRPVAAAIDIGSNSIKMTIAQPDGDHGLMQLDWASEVVRLGHGLDASGRLDPERITAAIATLHRFAERARERGATRIVAVATEATRAAANGEAFLDQVREETGIDVRVVNGDAEAALTFRGLAATTDLTGPVVIADIGGGSTEVIVANDSEMQRAMSIPLGSGRLTEKLMRSDPPSQSDLAAGEGDAARAFAEAATSLNLESGSGSRLIIVGGTGEFMARLIPDATDFSITTVRQVLVAVAGRTAAELAEQIDIPEPRARVLPAGVAIVAAIAEYVRPDRIEIAHSGVRAGLLLESFQERDRSGTTLDTARVPTDGSATKANPDPGIATTGQERQTREPGFRDTMKALIAERWVAVWAAVPVALEGTDIEGVHDVRVASRRLRAAMDIAAPVFPRRWYRTLHRTAKEITGALGEVRDRDVLLEALRADRDSAPLPERPGIDRLIERVDHERAAARVEMEVFLRELLEGPVRGEIERRFGPLPHANGQTRSGNGDRL